MQPRLREVDVCPLSGSAPLSLMTPSTNGALPATQSRHPLQVAATVDSAELSACYRASASIRVKPPPAGRSKYRRPELTASGTCCTHFAHLITPRLTLKSCSHSGRELFWDLGCQLFGWTPVRGKKKKIQELSDELIHSALPKCWESGRIVVCFFSSWEAGTFSHKIKNIS